MGLTINSNAFVSSNNNYLATKSCKISAIGDLEQLAILESCTLNANIYADELNIKNCADSVDLLSTSTGKLTSSINPDKNQLIFSFPQTNVIFARPGVTIECYYANIANISQHDYIGYISIHPTYIIFCDTEENDQIWYLTDSSTHTFTCNTSRAEGPNLYLLYDDTLQDADDIQIDYYTNIRIK